MLSIVGFSDAAGAFSDAQPPSPEQCPSSSPSPAHTHGHRTVRRQRSLLSESIRVSSSSCLLSRAPSCESMGSGELSSSFSEACDAASAAACEQSQPGSSSSSSSSAEMMASPTAGHGIAINYDRPARARIDRAEAQGRRRDEQLEMLHAVRQYMAHTKALGKALQCSSASSGSRLPPSC